MNAQELKAGSPIIKMREISKSYGGIQALHHVNLDIRAGRALAFVGENGAGKSTLMKILSGIETPDSGTIEINGTAHTHLSPKQARELGISIVHQELSLLSAMSVAENIFLGREATKRMGVIDKRRCNEEARKALDAIGIDISEKEVVGKLSSAQRQLIEIAAAIYGNVKVLILDEPTSSLSEREIDHLRKIVETLKRQDIAIVFISHKLNEVFDMCDDVVVLRDGNVVHTCGIDEIDVNGMIAHMVGRNVVDGYVAPQKKRSETPTLTIRDLRSTVNDGVSLKNISLEVHSGEIVGMFGLVGAGRTEIIQTLFGLRPHQSLNVNIDGAPVEKFDSRTMISKGVVWVPEDRRKMGLTLDMSIKDNIGIPNIHAFSKHGVVSLKKYESFSKEKIRQFSIKAPNTLMKAKNLSGGNQQKVVLAKWLSRDPKVIILDEPTRGIDVGSKSEIHQLIRSFRDQGKAVLVISSEIEELLSLADRIIVVREGEISGEVSRAVPNQVSERNIMHFATIGKGGVDK